MAKKIANIKCLVCDKPLRFPSYIDTVDYDGQVKCQECGSVLHIKLVQSKVRKYKIIDKHLIQNIIVHTSVPRPDYSKEA